MGPKKYFTTKHHMFEATRLRQPGKFYKIRQLKGLICISGQTVTCFQPPPQSPHTSPI